MSDGGRAPSPNGAGSKRLRTSADYQSTWDCRSLITTGSPGACRVFFPPAIDREAQHLLRFLTGCASRMRAGFPQPPGGRAEQTSSARARGERDLRAATRMPVFYGPAFPHTAAAGGRGCPRCCKKPSAGWAPPHQASSGHPTGMGTEADAWLGFGMATWLWDGLVHSPVSSRCLRSPPPPSAAEANEGKRKISVPEEEGSWVH